MKVISLNAKRLTYLTLPNNIEGSFWITDPEDQENKLINIEARDNAWYLISNSDNYVIQGNTSAPEVKLELNTFYNYGNDKEKHVIYVTGNYDKTMHLFAMNGNANITIGNDTSSNIAYNIPFIKGKYGTLTYADNKWTLFPENNTLFYINNERVVEPSKVLFAGDTVFIMGLVIVVINNQVIINSPSDRVKITNSPLALVPIPDMNSNYEEVKEEDYYKEEDYFFKTPRLRRFISTYKIKIAAPPTPNKEEEIPLILLLGPMVTMAMTSCVSLLNVVLKIVGGETTVQKSWTTLLTSSAMLLSMFLWPNLTKKWKKRQLKRKEKERLEKYRRYLDGKKRKLEVEGITQRQILTENLLDMKDCYDIISNRRRTLWERKSTQKDFLTVKVGTGDIPLDAEIEFNEEEFSIEEEDKLKKETEEMIESLKILPSSPVGYSFYNKKVTAIMGVDAKLDTFIDNIILQLVTFHSFDDLKIVVFTGENHTSRWNYIKDLPHAFSNDREVRFFATNEEERKKVSDYLVNEFLKRAQGGVTEDEVAQNEAEETEMTFLPYYLILTDDYMDIRKLGITELVMKSKTNFGFGFVIKENRLSKLPSECEDFINVGTENSSILCNNIDNPVQQTFSNELVENIDMHVCAKTLANIPIEFDFESRNIPTSLTFLEMYKVGKVEQLNTLNRWRLNDPTKSLRTPIGVNDSDQLIHLDLHEKYHGPHGLIAGTTGSGKSEFIITFILSMALNYSPNEVAFILIDYKGGGLAGAFENKKNNVRLPHLAGTITNLDKNELNRTLVSIDSELKRRQEKFNAARDELGESTMDIYKYQKFFREKKLSEPIPHLFIVCDEFAELKAQQPEFMDNLISAARIGRSLGVHLILATQKPSGVVNDQIWSNTKFRVCLKVQDASDSNEMLKCPDAAQITNAGRFYLQVGMNEIFVLGQSGYCGAPYIEKETLQKEVDRSVVLIDNTGENLKQVDVEVEKPKVNVEVSGDELSNILKYITNIAARESLAARTLWLDNIPENIYINNLIDKYSFARKEGVVTALLGEYDDPSKQKQGLVTLDLDSEGNTMIYSVNGVSREMFLKALIYSTSIMYSTEDINFYIFDFGSESLRAFNKLPHVGDIVFVNETEKVEKLFGLIDAEIVRRKNLFAEYNGDYATYCKLSGNKLPIYTVIINNMDSFNESYMAYDEILNKIAREGKRYGIVTVIAATAQSGMYSKFLRNFNHQYCINLNGKDDYTNILGKIGNVLPSDYDGRGLFKDDIAYEFQTARICDDDALLEFVKTAGEELKKINTYVPEKVPVLPEKITLDMIASSEDSIKAVPLGIYRDSLNIAKYNFKQDKMTIITSTDNENIVPMLKNTLKAFKNVKNIATVVINGEDCFSDLREFSMNYYDKDFNDVLTQVSTIIDEKIINSNYELVVMITGVDKMLLKMDKAEFTKFFDKIKPLENVSVILSDTSFKLKQFAFESWYSGNSVNVNGIWVGSGVMDQPVIKLSDVTKKYKEKLSNDYAWQFKNGNGTLLKLINSGEGDDGNEE